MRMSSNPAAAKISASPSFAQQMPRAPRASCCRAMRDALVGLGVRPEPPSRRVDSGLHPVDVALEARLLDEHTGGRQVGDAHGPV